MKTEIGRLFPLILLVLSTAGCGVFGQCSNKCPAGFEHDVWCGCFKPEPQKPGGASSNVPSALSPEWVCPVAGSATEHESWQADSGFGSNMNALIGKTVPFASRKCDVSAIPFLRQAANCQLDDKGDPFCTTPGTRSVMVVSSVIRRTNLLNGGVAWGVRGTIRDQAVMELNVEPNAPLGAFVQDGTFKALSDSVTRKFADAGSGVAARLSSLPFAALDASAPESCAIHCQKEDEFCAVANVDQVDAKRWQELIAQIRLRPPTLSKQRFMETAAGSKDACSRSDLMISADGMFSNTGNNCNMEIPFDGGTASVSLPERVAGALSFPSLTVIDVAFPNAAESPAVDFSDKEIHEEFGGVITNLGLAARAVTISTSSGKCIQLRR